jgi:hypothetical protein
LEENGKRVKMCAFDSGTYANSDRLTERLTRADLKNAGDRGRSAKAAAPSY